MNGPMVLTIIFMGVAGVALLVLSVRAIRRQKKYAAIVRELRESGYHREQQ